MTEPHKAQANASLDILTAQEYKGFLYEKKIVERLSGQLQPFVDNITFNPLTPLKWKRSIAKGPDIEINVNKTIIHVECKYHSTRTFPSWIKRDTLSRFKNSGSNIIKVVLTNSKIAYSPTCKHLLSDNDIKLLYDSELYSLIYKLYRKGNKRLACWLREGLYKRSEGGFVEWASKPKTASHYVLKPTIQLSLMGFMENKNHQSVDMLNQMYAYSEHFRIKYFKGGWCDGI